MNEDQVFLLFFLQNVLSFFLFYFFTQKYSEIINGINVHFENTTKMFLDHLYDMYALSNKDKEEVDYDEDDEDDEDEDEDEDDDDEDDDEVVSKKDEVVSKKDEVVSKKDEVVSKKDEVVSKKDEVVSKKDEVVLNEYTVSSVCSYSG